MHKIIFTHHKCGTTWLKWFLDAFSKKNGLSWTYTHRFDLPRAGKNDLVLFQNSLYGHHIPMYNLDRFDVLHVVRNPLDIVVSAYYSHRYSHSLDGWGELKAQRVILESLEHDAGMLATWMFLERSDFYGNVPGPLYALRNWDYLDDRMLTVRIEDIFHDRDYANVTLSRFLEADVAELLNEFPFEALAGREVGEVDFESHFRSGKAGQWMEELTPDLVEAICKTHQTLIGEYYNEAILQWTH